MEVDPSMANLPDLWAPGAAFACSGVDAPTESRAGFSATLSSERYSLLLHTPTPRIFQARLPTIDNPLLVTGDVLLAETQADELFLTWAAWHTVIGLAPKGTHLRLALEDGTVAEPHGRLRVSLDPQGRDAVALFAEGPQFVLSFGRSVEEAAARAQEGLSADYNAITQERMAMYARVPSLGESGQDRLLRKCFSTIKGSIRSAEGTIRQRWCASGGRLVAADSAMAALALARVYPGVAWEIAKSALELQDAEGMIPAHGDPAGQKSALAAWPMLAWATWELHLLHEDKSLLEWAYPRLEDSADWLGNHRDRNRNGLLEWSGAEEALPGAAGRFAGGVLMDAPDFSALAASDMTHLAKMAAAVGDSEDTRYWLGRAAHASAKVHELLWDASAGRYADRHMDGSFSREATGAGLPAMVLDDLPDERLDRTLAAMEHAAIPSAPIALRIWLSLQRQGRDMEAEWLRRGAVDAAMRSYENRGILCDGDGAATAAAIACMLLMRG